MRFFLGACVQMPVWLISYVQQSSFMVRVDWFCVFHFMDHVVVLKLKIWEGKVLSSFLQADKAQKATGSFLSCYNSSLVLS